MLTVNSTYETQECTSGQMNKMCCDPPGGASDAPVDPAKLFEEIYRRIMIATIQMLEESNNDEGNPTTLGMEWNLC